MACRSLITQSSTRRILCVPAVIVSSCALKRRTRALTWWTPASFWKALSRKLSRRCRINRPAQIRIACTLLLASGLAVLGGCRQDMHNQPKFIPLRSSEFYTDRRSARYPVPGTIPQLEDKNVDREQLDPNSYYLAGKHGNVYGNEVPTQLGDSASASGRAQLLVRGQQRYNIYCTPCHSMVGDGDGMIVQR